MRIFLLPMETAVTLLSVCSPGQDRASDCKEWDTVALWQTATQKTVANCLEAAADINAKDLFGETPLHEAVLEVERKRLDKLQAESEADQKRLDKLEAYLEAKWVRIV